ncbi:MAG: GTPase Era, partial [Myxococcota bacterium]
MRAGFISIVGRPNVGKSTLVNRLVGQKVAIVTPKPQTTRNRILAVANGPDAQLVFLDTPGIHKPRCEMDRAMLDTAVESLKSVDVVLLVVDIEQRFGRGDEHVLDLVKKAECPVVLGINKIDARKKQEILPLIERYRHLHDFADIVPLSALTGDNVDRLEQVLVSHLPEGEPLYPEETLTDLPERFFVSEMVREKILRLTRHEVPHSTAVIIDAWDEDAALTRIEATVLVERDSQKAILVGKGGAMMKKIGTSAREDAEAFLGTKVYLGLHVKVRGDWRDNKRILSDLGIGINRG